MSQQQQSVVKEVKLGSSDKFQTIISLKDVQSPLGNVELRFETIFAKAKDPGARQKKAQFFLTHEELVKLNDEITTFLLQTQ